MATPAAFHCYVGDYHKYHKIAVGAPAQHHFKC